MSTIGATSDHDEVSPRFPSDALTHHIPSHTTLKHSPHSIYARTYNTPSPRSRVDNYFTTCMLSHRPPPQHTQGEFSTPFTHTHPHSKHIPTNHFPVITPTLSYQPPPQHARYITTLTHSLTHHHHHRLTSKTAPPPPLSHVTAVCENLGNT